MKKYLSVFGVTAILLFLVSSTGFALNITVSDGKYTKQKWHKNQEDQEVEPGMQHGQSWDMEAFFLNGSELSIVSGYDMQNGYGGRDPGHIFIDVDGDAEYGDVDHAKKKGNFTVQDTFGYDYAIVTDFETMTYDVIELTDSTKTITSYEKANQGSNPWRYAGGGKSTSESGSFTFEKGLTNEQSGGFLGGKHFRLSGIDLGFLGAGTEFTAHYTMGCGNDNLMGQGTVPTPEPSSLILLGFGVFAFFGFKKRQAGLKK